MGYFSVFSRVLKNFSLLNPHLSCQDISKLDFPALKHLGIKFLVFDKDNTLTKTYSPDYYSISIESSLKFAINTFGSQNLGLLSNSLRPKLENELFRSEIAIIPWEKRKKPLNFEEIVSFFHCEKPEEIAIIGDRLLTDVLLANLNGALSILVQPLERTHEKIAIKFMRFLEEKLVLSRFRSQRREHSAYSREEIEKIVKKT